MKRPSFQFYPSDWLRDTGLRTCSIGARGLWIDMICYMHEGTPYGVLKVGSKVILPANLATMVGATLPEIEGWLEELESVHVFDRDENGAIMSRRMIRDENVREMRAAGGKLGGNPALKDGKVNLRDNLGLNLRVNLKDETKVNQKPTPSSSSSSSSSSNKEEKDVQPPETKPAEPPELKLEEDVQFPPNLDTMAFRLAWQSYMGYRKSGRMKNLQPVSIAAQLKKLSGWGHDTAIAGIEETIANGYIGIFPPKTGPAGTIVRPVFTRQRAASCL